MTATTQESQEHTTRRDAPDLTVRGIADISDGRGYLLAGGYRRSLADIPLPAALIRQYGLRWGDEIEGTAIAPRGRTSNDGASQGQPGGRTRNGSSQSGGTRNGSSQSGGSQSSGSKSGTAAKAGGASRVAS